MDTWNTCIEVTPVGRYVHAMHKADRQLEFLQHPGIFSKDPRVKQIATAVYNETNNLRGHVQDELRRFGGMVIEPEIPLCREEGCTEPAEDFGFCAQHDPFLDEPLLPEMAPHFCKVCNLCNIHGAPSCCDDACPNPLRLVSPTPEEWERFYREDEEARNFSDGRGDC